jgi:hypothetical protein
LAAASAGAAAAGAWAEAAGRDDGSGAFAIDAEERGAGGVPGSGVMMLTGGVEAAVGNSALVGLPVGIDGARAATGAAAADAGAFHDAEYLMTRPS